MRFRYRALLVGILSLGTLALVTPKLAQPAPTVTKIVYNRDAQKQAQRIQQLNQNVQHQIDRQTRQNRQHHQQLKQALQQNKILTTKVTPTATTTATSQLATLNFSGQQEITVQNNEPNFSAAELSTKQGPWQSYGNLDQFNRATVASALLNVKLMPQEPRSELTWNPTGWHNKRTAHGWLYNRSHLIGYQFTGQNNNPKNLITATQSLNTPLMLAHEMDIATYLKANPQHYVRYEVTPIYRGSELVARGVHMRAQSVGSTAIAFNIYIFNVQTGYTIHYQDGTSVKTS